MTGRKDLRDRRKVFVTGRKDRPTSPTTVTGRADLRDRHNVHVTGPNISRDFCHCRVFASLAHSPKEGFTALPESSRAHPIGPMPNFGHTPNLTSTSLCSTTWAPRAHDVCGALGVKPTVITPLADFVGLRAWRPRSLHPWPTSASRKRRLVIRRARGGNRQSAIGVDGNFPLPARARPRRKRNHVA